MEDNQIIEKLFQRDDSALQEITVKYSSSCLGIVRNILGNQEDAEELWNDTLMKTWNSIPPQKPNSLFAFLAVMIRNSAYDRYRSNQRRKRFGEQIQVTLDEFSECIPSGTDVVRETENRLSGAAVARFLGTQPKSTRVIFMQRYWAMMPVKEIAAKYALNENTVKSTLKRTRERLREYLEKEGYL